MAKRKLYQHVNNVNVSIEEFEVAKSLEYLDTISYEADTFIEQEQEGAEVINDLTTQLDSNNTASSVDEVITNSNEALIFSMGKLGIDQSYYSKFKITTLTPSLEEARVISNESIKGFIQTVYNTIKRVFESIVNWFKKIWSKLKIMFLKISTWNLNLHKQLMGVTCKEYAGVQPVVFGNLAQAIGPIFGSEKVVSLNDFHDKLVKGINDLADIDALNNIVDKKDVSLVNGLTDDASRTIVDYLKTLKLDTSNIVSVTYFDNQEVRCIIKEQDNYLLKSLSIPTREMNDNFGSDFLPKLKNVESGDYLDLNQKEFDILSNLGTVVVNYISKGFGELDKKFESSRKKILDFIDEQNKNSNESNSNLLKFFMIAGSSFYLNRFKTMIHVIQSLVKFYRALFKDLSSTTELYYNEIITSLKDPINKDYVGSLSRSEKFSVGKMGKNEYYIGYYERPNAHGMITGGFVLSKTTAYRLLDGATNNLVDKPDGKAIVYDHKPKYPDVIFLNDYLKGSSTLKYVYYHEMGHLVTLQENIERILPVINEQDKLKQLIDKMCENKDKTEAQINIDILNRANGDDKHALNYNKLLIHNMLTYFEDPIEIRAEAFALLKTGKSIDIYTFERQFGNIFIWLFPNRFKNNILKEMEFVKTLPSISPLETLRYEKLKLKQKLTDADLAGYESPVRNTRHKDSFAVQFPEEYQYIRDMVEGKIKTSGIIKMYSIAQEFKKKYPDIAKYDK